MRILVTGAAGFIGSALVRRLVARGEHVLSVDKLGQGRTLAALEGIAGAASHRFEQANIADLPFIENLLRRFRPHRLVHLAAETHVDRSIAGPGAFIEANVVAHFHLLEAVRAFLREEKPADFLFVQVSTDEVYGPLGEDGRSDEQALYRPSSPYAASKAAADHLAGAWATSYGVPVAIAHLCNVFGPFQHPEKLIPLMTAAAIDGRPLPVYGAGLNVREWLYVEDAAAALELVARAGAAGERYNVGSGVERRNLELVRSICRIIDRLRPGGGPHERLIVHVDDRPGHDHRYALDSSKARRELGWRHRHAFDPSLEDTVEWYCGNEQWWRPLAGTAPPTPAGGLAPSRLPPTTPRDNP